MKLSLFRAKTILVQIAKPGGSRAFVFDLEVGMGRSGVPVAPLSGMLLNLTEVDEILALLLAESRVWDSLREFVDSLHSHLEKELARKSCILNEFCLREKRGFFLGFRRQEYYMGCEHIYEMPSALMRIRWERSLEESLLESQSLSLKGLSSADDLGRGVERIFADHAELKSFEVENPLSREKWSWQR